MAAGARARRGANHARARRPPPRRRSSGAETPPPAPARRPGCSSARRSRTRGGRDAAGATRARAREAGALARREARAGDLDAPRARLGPPRRGRRPRVSDFGGCASARREEMANRRGAGARIDGNARVSRAATGARPGRRRRRRRQRSCTRPASADVEGPRARARARGARGVGFRREKGTFSQPSRGCPVQVPENRGRGPTFAYFAFAYARLRNHGLKSPTHHHRDADAASRRFLFAKVVLFDIIERRGGSRRGYFLAPFWSFARRKASTRSGGLPHSLSSRAPPPPPPPRSDFSRRVDHADR